MFFSSPDCVCLLNSNVLKNKSEINGRRPGPDNGVFVTEKCKKEYMSISRMSGACTIISHHTCEIGLLNLSLLMTFS